MSTRPKRTRKTTSRISDRNHHLHVVVDGALHTKLEAHARKLEGMGKTDDRKPNLSLAARDVLRKGLGLPGVDAA